jgi:hypothetical protein
MTLEEIDNLCPRSRFDGKPSWTDEEKKQYIAWIEAISMSPEWHIRNELYRAKIFNTLPRFSMEVNFV